MKYLALIYGDETAWQAVSDAECAAWYTRYTQFAEDAAASGVLVGGAELAPTRSATTVRLRDGETVVTDGPDAETQEALGGYVVLESASMEEAVDWAARMPDAEHGAVESGRRRATRRSSAYRDGERWSRTRRSPIRRSESAASP